ncbi:MAG: hypothetical protein KA436_08390 [Oligoflexales bacterium]|nr:hypothetical protein [Oligoflexales bacterium]
MCKIYSHIFFRPVRIALALFILFRAEAVLAMMGGDDDLADKDKTKGSSAEPPMADASVPTPAPAASPARHGRAHTTAVAGTPSGRPVKSQRVCLSTPAAAAGVSASACAAAASAPVAFSFHPGAPSTVTGARKARRRKFTTPRGRVHFVSPGGMTTYLAVTPQLLLKRASVVSFNRIYLIHADPSSSRADFPVFDASRFARMSPADLERSWTAADTASFLPTLEAVLNHIARCGRYYYVGHTCSRSRASQHASDVRKSMSLSPYIEGKGQGKKKGRLLAALVKAGHFGTQQVIVTRIASRQLAEVFEGLIILATEAQEKGANKRGVDQGPAVRSVYNRFLAADVARIKAALALPQFDLGSFAGDPAAEEEEEEEDGDLCGEGEGEDEVAGMLDFSGLTDAGKAAAEEAGAAADVLAATEASVATITSLLVDGVSHSVTVHSTERNGNCGFQALAAVQGGSGPSREEFIQRLRQRYLEILNARSQGEILTAEEAAIYAFMQIILAPHGGSVDTWASFYAADPANPVNWMQNETFHLYGLIFGVEIHLNVIDHALNVFTPPGPDYESIFNAGGGPVLHIAIVSTAPVLMAGASAGPMGISHGNHIVGLSVSAAQSEASSDVGFGAGSDPFIGAPPPVPVFAVPDTPTPVFGFAPSVTGAQVLPDLADSGSIAPTSPTPAAPIPAAPTRRSIGRFYQHLGF